MENIILKRESYNFIKLSGSKYSILIIVTVCEPPSKLLDKIAEDLSAEKICGEIIIDSLLYNGNSNERFISAYFCGNQFKKGSFKFIKIDRGDILRTLTSEFLRSNYKLVEYSILNSFQKKLLLKGCNL
ncbi:type II toxin-antitoxin system RnlB family antitoxin [Thermoanaerobacter uzonensis]|uniref:type II toxin-antitoxin system RnlB family antitoxin n=1 Tax=Thermoanaerobacter uzonensis TaxID=447593 RepID=UPI003D766C99